MVFVAVLGLAVLMIVHELGHYLAARRFGMRVTKFSIGFGPALWKHQPKGSPTTFQIGIIPFLAYVQIAGMNPYEEVEPNDKGSYANASLWARIVTIFAGSLANYLFASVFFFFGLLHTGLPHADLICNAPSVCVAPRPDGPAAKAGIREGDRIATIDGSAIKSWDDLAKAVTQAGQRELVVQIEREGQLSEKRMVPAEGKIQVGPHVRIWYQKLTIYEAAVRSLKAPTAVIAGQVGAIGRWIRGKEKVELGGPGRMVSELSDAAREGIGSYLTLLGAVSAWLAAFNLFPLPALDGGRLIFLAFEAVSRRRPNAKAEGIVHAVGLLVFLGLMAVVTVVSDIPHFFKK
jgi:regulator of sigma E protease